MRVLLAILAAALSSKCSFTLSKLRFGDCAIIKAVQFYWTAFYIESRAKRTILFTFGIIILLFTLLKHSFSIYHIIGGGELDI